MNPRFHRTGGCCYGPEWALSVDAAIWQDEGARHMAADRHPLKPVTLPASAVICRAARQKCPPTTWCPVHFRLPGVRACVEATARAKLTVSIATYGEYNTLPAGGRPARVRLLTHDAVPYKRLVLTFRRFIRTSPVPSIPAVKYGRRIR